MVFLVNARLMCAWDTTAEDVDGLVADIRQHLG